MRNSTGLYTFLFALLLLVLPNTLNAQCPSGQIPNSFCPSQFSSNTVGFEFCPNSGEIAQSTIIAGTLGSSFPGIPTALINLTVYEGASSSGISGSVVSGPINGDISGTVITATAADLCLIFVFTSTPGIFSCAEGFDAETEVCSESLAGTTVTFTALADLCVNAGVQSGLSGGSPTGGIYSGSGVTDDGNGMTYSFDPAAAGVGTHILAYTNGGSATDDVEVFTLPTTTFTALADLCIDAGVQTGLGGGSPAGGVYSGTGVTDDGNGSTYSFDPSAAGLGVHTITYTESSTCMNSASDMVEVLAACGCPAGQTSFFHCSSPSEVNLVIFEVCPSAGMAAQATITQGTYTAAFGNNLSVYEGASGSGLTGTLISGPLTGDLTGTIIMGNGADNCLIFVSNVPAIGCSSGAETSLKVCGESIASSVTFTAPADICIYNGVQTGLSGGSPTGGVYSGPGVADDGNGMTYSFDPAGAGVGTHILIYTESGIPATDDIEVFAAGTAGCLSFIALNDLCVNAGVQTGLSGGSPTGGIYSGSGVTDDGNGMTYSFDPAGAGIGVHTLTYTQGGNFTTDDVEVFSIPTVTLNITTNSTISVCAGVTLYTLTATPTGGVFSGAGVTNLGDGISFTFNPVIAGIGTHTVTYSFTNTDGCSAMATDNIQVVSAGSTFTAPADLCINSGVQAGLGGGTPTGGVYSGPGVTDDGNGMTYSFDPAAAGVGTHTLLYTLGCIPGAASDDVEVFAIPTAAFTAPADLCVDAGVQAGLGGGTPTGGVYSGPGVTDDGNGMTYSFDPAAAGVGTHMITYTVGVSGCTDSASDDVEVFALPLVSLSVPGSNGVACINAGVQTGLNGGTPTGGIYSGSGVTDDGNGMTFSFDPAAAGLGTHTLTYTITDANGCSNGQIDLLFVRPLPTVNFTAPADLCLNDGVQAGLGGGTPPQGTLTGDLGVYSGSGVTDDGNGMTYSFDPAGAGVGTHTLTYTYSDDFGCTNSASDDIEVFALPIVTFTAPADLCITAGVQAGLGGGTPTGGVYSGPGVTDDGNGMTYSFDPAAAGVGTHMITYTVGVSGCTDSASDDVEVFALPLVSLSVPGSNGVACINAGVQTGLNGGTPTGGIYSGSGVTDDGNGMTFSFDPAAAGLGTHTLTYTITDANGCSNGQIDLLFVRPLPTVNFTAPADLCLNDGVQAGLGGGTPPQGTLTGDLGVYSGSGVTDDGNGMTYSFDPAGAGVGTHTLTYTYSDDFGCTNSASDDIEVFALPIVTFTAPADLCITAGVQAGLGGGTPGGGVYSGSGVTDDGNGMTYSFDPAAAGVGTHLITYTFTDANGCSGSANDNVEVFSTVTASFTALADLCENDGIQTGLGAGIPVAGVGETGIYSGLGVTDDGNGMTYSFDPAVAGVGTHIITYTFTTVDGCMGTAMDDVEVLTAPIAVATSLHNGPLCSGETIQLNASGGINYLWQGPNGFTSIEDDPSIENATALASGTYTVTVTAANGCDDVASVMVLVNSPFDISFTNVVNADCLGGETGTATAIANNGIGYFTYAWSNGQSTAIASNLHAGGYSVTATDANGCTSESSLAISDPNGLDISVLNLSNVSCYGGSNGSATLSVTGGTGPYTLNGYYRNAVWNATNTAFGPGTSQLTVNNLTEGQYSFFVEDDNGCQISISTTIDEPTFLISNIFTSTDVSCNGDSDGTATVYATGGTTPYTYLWSDGQTTVTATGLAADNYTVTVYDANNCEATASVTIGEPATLSLTQGATYNVSCNGGSDGAIYIATNGGTGPYNYEWFSTNGGFFPADNTEEAVNIPAGSYGVIVTDANGCTFELSPMVITEPTAVTVSIGNVTNANCAGNEDGSATATAGGGTGAITYAWSDGQTGANATGLHAGGYSVTATDANGCTAQASTSISDPNAGVLLVMATNDVSCNGGSDGDIQLQVVPGTGTPPYTLVRYVKDGLTATNVNMPFGTSSLGAIFLSVDNMEAGHYAFRVEDGNGCFTFAEGDIHEPTLLIAEIISTTDALCNGSSDGTATVNATGGTTGYTYAWPNGQTTATATGLAAGTYTVTVTDANLCEATATATIGEPDLLTLSLALINDVSCNGGSDGDIYIDVNGGTGPYNYYWLGATAADNTQDAVDVPAGIYSLTVVDANGCFFTLSNLVVNQPPVLTVSIGNVTNADCAGNETGSATAYAAGGTGSYSYAWSNGDNTATAWELHAGGYSVTVTDENGCTAQASVSITDPHGMSLEVINSSQPWCHGDDNGSVTLGILKTGNLGGTPPYRLSYVYHNGINVSGYFPLPMPFNGDILYVDNLEEGQYVFIVQDDNNCEVARDFTMDEPTLLIADVTTTTDVSCYGGSDGTATVYATGGTTPYGYAWSNGQTTVTATGLSAGTHSVTVTDANGCQESEEVVIGEPDVLSLTENFTINVSCNGGSDGYIYMQTNGGTAPYNYNWGGPVPQPIDNAEDAQNIAAGTYSVTVTDANGCTDSVEGIVITEPTELTVTIGNVNNADCAGNETGSATATAAGGTGSYTYAWSNGDITATATALHAGGYSVTATDANGCTAQASVSITDPTGMSMEVIQSSEPLCNGDANGSVTLAIYFSGNLGGTPPYTLAQIFKDGAPFSSPGTTFPGVNGNNPLTVNNLSAGQYAFIVVDNNGCEVVEEHTVDEPTLLIAEIISSTRETCLNAADGTAVVNATGGTTPYTYLWSDGQTTYDATGFVAGTYTVTVTDANDCEAVTSVVIGDPDTTDPIIESFVDLTLNCSNISSTTDPTALITQWLENNYVASDETELVGVIFDYTPITLDICTASTTVVTWTATDACGNTATATSNLIIVPDETDPILTIPAAPLALDCQAISSTSSPAALIADWLAQASATDDCDNAPSLTHDFNMGTLDVCAAADYSITVTWTATDACGNDVSASQTIDVTVDATAPTLTVPSAPLALDCQAISSTSSPAALIADWLAEASATDGCDNAPVLTHDFNMGMLDVCAAADYSITVTWTATDACGNDVSDSQTIDVTVDATAPTLTVPASPLALDCGAISSTSSPAALIDAWLATAGATDGCDNAPVLTHDFNMGVLDICAPADYSITVTWTATDACGNDVSDSQTIDVTVDVTAPVVIAPADITVDCEDISNTSSPAGIIANFLAGATASDDCASQVTLTYDLDNTALNVCSPTTSNFCATPVTHFGGNPPNSQALLTVENVGGNIEVTATSGTSSPIDFLLIEGPGFTPVSSTTVVNGEITVTIPFAGTPPTNFEFQALWSLEDFGGNWQLAVPSTFASTPFSGSCSAVNSNFCSQSVTHFGGNPANSEAILTVENVGGNIEVTATSGTSSPIDFLLIEGPGFTPVASTTVVNGEIKVTIPFGGTPPAEFQFQALWSLEDFGGNWQLAVPGTFASTPFNGTCIGGGDNIVTVTWTATDDCGNTGTATSTITVEPDTEAPMIDTPADVTLDADVNCNALLPDYTSNPATDNCDSDVQVTQSPLPGTVLSLGTTEVTLTATDNCGNFTDVTFDVTVEDNTNPVALCQDFTVQLDGTGNATITVADVNNGSYDNCSVASVAIDISSFTCADLGSDNQVTLTVTDGAGNTATCISNVTVEDNIAPTFTCPSPVDVQGCDGLVPDLISTIGDEMDNCGVVTLTQNPLPGVSIGNNGNSVDVVITATDASGNATSCTVTVTVVDDTAPVFQNCPAAIAVANDPDQCGAIVSWIAPVALDNCVVMGAGSVVLTAGMPSGSVFPVGTSTVTYTATDDDGNTATCTFDITVSDTEAPEFITTLPADETVECDAIPDPFVVIPMMHTADNCTESMNIVVDYGEEIIDIICANTYTIVRTWTITDEAGNSAVHKQKVYVQDTTAPTFTVPADVTIECDEDTSPVNTGDVTDQMDNCSAPADIVVAFTDVEDLTGCGGYTGTITRTWTATDECGNVTTQVQVITIEDTTGPDAVCQNITVELDENGEVTISANQINNGSTDNCAAQSALTLSLSKSSFTCADIGENIVTLTVTDPCGNIGTCVATVTVEDNIAPVITCPGDMTIHLDPGACEQVISYDVLATDNCDVTVEQIAGPYGSGDGFPIGGPYVLTYEATDEGGNTAQCSFTVTVFEYVPTSNDMTCNSLVNLSLDENCEAIITADQILEGNNYGCYDDYIITSEDANGNVIPGNILDITHVGTTITVTITDPVTGVNCWGLVYVEDKLIPEFDCPADITIACSENAVPALTGEPVITSCELSHTVTSVDVFTDFGQCADPRAQIERTWTVTDDSGNSATCVQIITIAAVDLADVTFPADLVDANALECSDVANDPSLIESGNAGFPTINGLEITNSGLCMASINVTDEIYDICEGSYEILRTWKVRNMCLPIGPGNPVEHTQIIKVLDTEGPVVVAPADITISTDGTSCETGFVAPAANISDACSSFSVVTDTPFGSLVSNGGSLSQALGLGTHTITYIATDGCGNVGFDEMTVTVEDQIAPIAICDENTTVSLDNNGFASIDAITFDDGSTDNCSAVTFDVRKVFNACDPSNNAFGPSVSFCCEEVGTEVMVELRVTDAAGNVNACMVLVDVQDKIDPTIICAPSVDVDCSATYLDDIVVGQPLPQAAIDANGEALASDNCSGVMLTNNVISNTIDCGSGAVTIVWTATDAGGRTTSCIQIYTVANGNPFVEGDITWPLDYETSTCGNGLEPDDLSSPYDYPVTEAAACSNIAVGHDDQVLDFGAADACLKILRTWYVVDWCQATANQDPTQPGPGVWHHTQIIKVVNSNDPNVTVVDFPSVVDNFDADCGTVTATFEITADDDCTSVDDLDVTWEFSTGLSGTGFTASGDFLNGSYSVTFTVDDQCGNSTTEVHNFTVVDAKKPTPVCIFGIATTVMPSSGSVTISASDFESGSSFDNCTAYDDLQFSFSQDVNNTEIVITCDDIPANGLVAVDLYVTDEAGNFDFCSTFISVQDPNFVCPNPAALITGTIENEFQEVIEEVTVTLSDDNGAMTLPVVTGPTGVFQFNETYGDYDVTPEKDINYLNGVTTYDLVLISKHILGIELLDSPYKMIAADANNSQSISALDLVKIRALILHLEDEFTNNTSWRFVDQDYVFPNPVNPWQEDFPEYIGLTSTAVPANFTALKVGDVNGSASPNSLLGSDTRTFSGNLALQLEATKVAEGETFTVDFKAKDFIEIAGYQFTLGFDQDAVDFVEVTSNLQGLGSDNFGLAKLEEGAITTSWNSSKGINVEDNTVLFSMTFLANTTVSTAEIFTINSRYTESEAYNGTDLFDVVLEFNGNIVESVFELYQNTPNPFKEETMISFNLPQASAVTLRIMDVSGRTLKLIKLDDAVKGMNSVSLTRDEFNATGVLYYQLESADHTATMKMIIVD